MSNPGNPGLSSNIQKATTTRLLSLEGEYDTNPDFPAPGLMSLYNFNFSWAGRNALRCQNRSSVVGDYFESSAYTILMGSSVAQKGAEKDSHLWTAIELHDWPRFLGLQPHRLDVLMTPVAWLLTSPGAPLLYYGVEQGFNGHCVDSSIHAGADSAALRKLCNTTRAGELDMFWGTHPDELKRQDMFVSGPFRMGSAVPEINDLAYMGSTTPALSAPWQLDKMLQRNHPMFKFTRKMVTLRNSCRALAVGAIQFHEAAPIDCGLLAYSRFIKGADSADTELVVVLSPGINPDPAAVTVGEIELKGDLGRKDGQRYANALNTSQGARLRLTASGRASLVFEGFQAEPGDIFVFAPESGLLPFNSTLGIALCKGAPVGAGS